MKKWIITLNLLFYITFLNHWNFVESQPLKGGSTTPDSAESSSTATNPTPVSTTVTPITLDINKSKDTSEFYFKKDGKFRTYTSRPGYLFSKIMKKGLVTSGVEIWTAKPNDNAIKVVLMGSGKEPKHLAILLKNDNFVLLRKPGKNKPWTDITSKRRDVTKLKFLGDNDAELSKNDYKASLVDLFYEITFNDGVSCRKITYADAEVWNHVDDTKFSEIKKLSVDLPLNKFSVTNKSDEVKKIEKEFKTEGEDEGAPITLDINKTQGTDEFDYSLDDSLHTFTAKPGYVFDKISEGTTGIWESTDIYAKLVKVMTKTAFLSKTGVSGIFAIFLSNNTFKFFIQTGNKWKDATTSRHDITKLKFLGDNDTEITSSDYSVSIVKLSFTYTFNTGVKCKKVKLEDDEVWKDSDSKFAEIKSISLDLLTNTFSVMNSSDQTKELDFKPTTPPKGTPTSQTQSAKPASGTSSGTQPPKASGTGTPQTTPA